MEIMSDIRDIFMQIIIFPKQPSLLCYRRFSFDANYNISPVPKWSPSSSCSSHIPEPQPSISAQTRFTNLETLRSGSDAEAAIRLILTAGAVPEHGLQPGPRLLTPVSQ
ncbi:hypothetical protein CRENBAI_021413 [Crenichthys baileyi]|uniref:Uncharacterized protein n=1 Tax=Crenichthys baileyi TaxID=28760 RepID=A0AAV9S3E1_9TELE